MPERQFQVFFFHLLINLETELGAWKWNFYRANKTFLHFPGIFASTEPLDEKPGSLESLKIMRMRKTISTTEHPAIRQISVYDPALLFVILFISWVVWIIMKWIVLEDKFRLYCPDHF